MKINKITLKNYRNIKEETFEFSDGIQLIAGQNAQGKTNLLEAVYMGATMRSFRTSKESQLIFYGEKNAEILLWFEEKEREHTLELKLGLNESKQVLLDGRKMAKTRDAIGIFQSVLFTPDHLMMMKGSPGERREFLDIALCALSPKYREYLLCYAKALKNRNKILKENDKILVETLPVWEQTLCKYGSFIAVCRQEYIKTLDQTAQKIYKEISGGRETEKIIYINQFSKEEQTEEGYYNLMLSRLEKTREKDIENGTTGVGVHKDDMLTLLAGKSVKYFASQGQIRSCVLSVKLAEAELMEQRLGTGPVILLDDILSELDENRQNYILEHSFQNQCIVTTCEPNKLQKFSNSMIFMEKGRKKENVFTSGK